MQSAAKHLTIRRNNQHVSRSLSTVSLHCDLFSFMPSTRRDPSVAAFPLDDVEEQVSGLPPLLAGEDRRGRHAERSISP